jgi:two-component system response regulator DevR
MINPGIKSGPFLKVIPREARLFPDLASLSKSLLPESTADLVAGDEMMYMNTLTMKSSGEQVTVSSDETRVFLLCENRLLREALIRILGKRCNVLVVGACGYSPEALAEVVACQPQVVLLDSFGIGLAQPHLLRRIRESLVKANMVMVGMEPKEENFLLAVREGAAGYVLREASAAEVVSAIRAVASGEAVCPPCFTAMLFRCASQQLTIRQNLRTRSRHGLSRREQQLVELICFGLTNKEIAGRLHLSEHTVKNHIHRILHKTGVPDRISIVDRYHSQMSMAGEISAVSAAGAEMEGNSQSWVLP